MSAPHHFELKPLSPRGISAALQKAMRYRLLNEPAEAESICLDILEIDPDNQEALITLLLAITDRFRKGYGVSDSEVRQILPRLKSEYDRAYYSGIIAERRGKSCLHSGTPGAGGVAYEHLLEAMESYEKAEDLRPPGNDDAILRWNTCARLIMRNKLEPLQHEATYPLQE